MGYKRTRNIFNPNSDQPYKLSRSRLEMFLNCSRCFYLDRRLGIDRPSIPAFTLNSAVDHLLKKEFDEYRQNGKPHPIMIDSNIEAVPLVHEDLEKWRHNFTGVQVHHEATKFLFFGAVDDVWTTSNGELIVVDYKATSKDGEVTLDGRWQQAYKRQMEIYQWLLEKNGFKVSNTGYFVYANGRRDLDAFKSKLLFNLKLIPYVGDRTWVDTALLEAHQCLLSDDIPDANSDCEYCQYRTAARTYEPSNTSKDR
ncbi:MAG: PD-(D/E)XK nuclease family protein [Bdellovibrionales bacterium]|nr:PD-(D/E)XK nuclease family protein [Bdellovibrionales bacterium]